MRTIANLIFATALLASTTALAQSSGESTYQANCVACHQATGQGIPGAFPPLAGHVPELLARDGGRTYLVHTLLYGLQGSITVGGQTYNGVMPAWQHLDDAQLADVLTYISTAWENEAELPEGFEPFTAEEVSAERDLGITGGDVLEERTGLLATE
ncbi:MAG: cytochrome c [Trueperaceae bacterium]|nr:cytochrome c [Trueperaceae bacterium]